MKMKKLISVMTAFAMVASLAACGGSTATTASSEAASVAESAVSEAESVGESVAAEASSAAESVVDAATGDTFTVGFDQDFPPMGFVGDDGEFTGFDLELAAEVASRLGKEIVYQPIAWDAKDMELESGTIDCIWNGFTINGREDGYTWSLPYMNNTQVFVVKADSGITDLAGLTGKTVEVQVDSSAEAALKDMPDLTSTFSNLQTTADYNTAFMDLDMGAVDAIAMDIIVAGYQKEQREDGDNFVILEDSIASEEYGVGFKKGNTELADLVNGALKDMAADGTMKTISEKWFGEDVTTIK